MEIFDFFFNKFKPILTYFIKNIKKEWNRNNLNMARTYLRDVADLDVFRRAIYLYCKLNLKLTEIQETFILLPSYVSITVL
jgi:hypothetical protein